MSLPERLRTRHRETVMAVMDRQNERLDWPSGGWKIGAASVEVQRTEGPPSPAPAKLRRDSIWLCYMIRANDGFFQAATRLRAARFARGAGVAVASTSRSETYLCKMLAISV